MLDGLGLPRPKSICPRLDRPLLEHSKQEKAGNFGFDQISTKSRVRIISEMPDKT